MHLVTTESLQLVRIECLAEGLLADQGPVGKLLFPGDVPGQDLAFQKLLQALGIGGSTV